MKRYKLILTFVFCSTMLQLSFAQYMDVLLTTASTKQFTISKVKTITFSGDQMNIKTTSTMDTTPLGVIRKITFGSIKTSVTYERTESGEICNIFPNPANNIFTALPAGYRDAYGSYYYGGYVGCWWSSSEVITYEGWYRIVSYNIKDVLRNFNYKVTGFSVRCIKN